MMHISFVGKTYYSNDSEESVFGYIFGYESENHEGVKNINQVYGENPSETVTYSIPTSLRTIHVTNDTTIGYGAFSNVDMVTTITLPNYVTSTPTTTKVFTTIGSHAFDGAKDLTSIIIPETTSSIGAYAFKNAEDLEVVTFNGALVTSYSEGLFYNCYKLDTIYSSSDSNNKVDKVTIGSEVTSIGAYAFYNNDVLKELKEVAEVGLEPTTSSL